MRVEFKIGAVLSRTFGIWLRNLVPFLILAAIVEAPLFLYTMSKLSGHISDFSLLKWSLVITGAALILDQVASGAIIYGVFQELRGRRAGILDCLRVGLRRTWPVMGVAVTTGLAVLLGSMMLVVPGVILAAMLWVAVPAAVVEEKGAQDAIKRSTDLTDGYRWHVFGVIAILLVIDFAAGQLLDRFILPDEPTNRAIRTWAFASLGLSVVTVSLSAVAKAVGYYDLRAAREGVDIEELARVFD